MISSDYSHGVATAVNNYISKRKDARISLWSERKILVLMERHPEISRRYGLKIPTSNYEEELSKLSSKGPKRVLLISDQSAFSHNLVSGLQSAGFEILFVPFWNYQRQVFYLTLQKAIEQGPIDLVVCLLGDSFGVPIHTNLISYIVNLYSNGTSVLFFPFFAWSINKGRYSALNEIIPVKLVNPGDIGGNITEDIYLAGSSTHGDVCYLFAFESFAEDQYVEIDPIHVEKDFSKDITNKIGISHSYEYLKESEGSKVIWKDSGGNPFLV